MIPPSCVTIAGPSRLPFETGRHSGLPVNDILVTAKGTFLRPLIGLLLETNLLVDAVRF